jgi:hypothetical protein
MKHSSVVAPGLRMGPRGRPASSDEPSLIAIASSLEAVEQCLAALVRLTPHAGPYAQEVHEIRLQIAALLTRPESAALGEERHPQRSSTRTSDAFVEMT